MAFELLSAKQKEIVLRCMKATAAYIDDWEKHTSLGLDPDELQSVISRWPDLDDRDTNGNGFLAINNCVNEVCHGFRIESEDWSTWFDVPISEIKETFEVWRSLRGISGGLR